MATKKYVSLEKLSLYDEKLKKHVSDADAVVLQSAKDYADGLAGNYDAAGSANTALKSAKSYTDTEVAKANSAAAAAQTQADKGVADAAAVQADVDALETYVGTIPEGYSESNVVAYVNKKAEETLASATGGSSESAASVLAALNTYKSENDPKVAANTTAAAAAQTAADNAQADADAAQEYAESVAGDLATEVSNRTNADTALDNRIQTLEGQITGLSGAMHFVGVKEAVPEDLDNYNAGDVITVGEKEYVFNGTAFVEFGDVSAEGTRIGNLETRMTTAEGNITQAQNDIDAVESDLADEVTARTNADTALSGRIATLESAVGESGSVAEDIATAKSEAISTAAADATSKANQALADAKTYADGLNTAMDTRVDALEADTHTHANQTELDLIATGDKAKWDAAAGKVHTHDNKTVLDGITAAKVSAWDAAEDNAKTYADGLNGAMATRMDAVEAWQTNMVEVSEAEINALFTA